MTNKDKQEATEMVSQYHNALIEFMPKDIVTKAFVPIIDKIRAKPQTYKNEIFPILAFVMCHAKHQEDLCNVAINIAEHYLSGNSIPISSRKLKEKDLETILNYMGNYDNIQ